MLGLHNHTEMSPLCQSNKKKSILVEDSWASGPLVFHKVGRDAFHNLVLHFVQFLLAPNPSPFSPRVVLFISVNKSIAVAFRKNWVSHILITPVCWNKANQAVYYRQAFTASILRLLHQVYEKMLNYINKMCTYQGWYHWNGGEEEYGVFGVCGKLIVSKEWYGERKALPHGIILTKWSCTSPSILLCDMYMGVAHSRGEWVVKLCSLS